MISSSDPEEIEMRLFLAGVHERYGYDLRGYNMGSLRRRLSAALLKHGAAHVGELQHRVLHDPELFGLVLHDLTVHVSELFRDPGFYRVFRSRVIPLLRTYPLIRIWHAGCAAGEEAYASAIILSEENLYDRAQIYATDLSAKILEDAKEGVYPESQFPLFLANYKKGGGQRDFSDYWTSAYDRIAIKDSLRRNILFFQHDLVSDHVFGEMHVVFCRNVFIYFAREQQLRVLEKLADSLCMGGFLCLGSSERVFKDDAGNRFANFAVEARIYRQLQGAEAAD